ncbi:MAG: hypothetical protein R3F61_03110 [Myxococcota bacterium]
MNRLATASLLAVLAGCSGTGTTDTDLPIDPMLDGSVYRLSVGGLTIEGAEDGLNDLVKLFFANEVLAQVTNVSETSLTMTLALGIKNTDPIQRNPCFGDISLPPVSLADLTFSLGPQDLEIPSATGSFSIGDLALDGTFSADGNRIDDLVLQGVVDFRLAEGSSFGTPDGLCESFGDLGAPCGACPDGQSYCADLTVTGLSATRVEGVDFAADAQAPDPGTCE